LKKSEVLSSTIDTNRSFISFSMTSRGSVSVNGKTIELDGDTLNNIIKLARESKTIEAIKELRSVTGLDLKEAKEMVEIIAQSPH
jgi:ribosomal protein L7/L12